MNRGQFVPCSVCSLLQKRTLQEKAIRHLIVLGLLLLASTTVRAELPYDSLPRKYNKAAVRYLVNQCISTRLHEARSDYAAKLLEQSCFEEVLNGTWDKNSRRRYELQRQRELWRLRNLYGQ